MLNKGDTMNKLLIKIGKSDLKVRAPYRVYFGPKRAT